MRSVVYVALALLACLAEGKEDKAAKKSLEIGAVQVGGEGVKESTVLDFNERQIININIPTTGEASKFEQAAVRFTHVSGVEVWFPLTVKSGSLKLDIDLPRHAEESFDNLSGEYVAAVVISDEHLSKNIQQNVVKVNLNLTPTPLWKQKQEFAESKDWRRRQPQVWDMKPKEERGSASMSLLFSGLLGVPVLVLLYLLFLAGANIKGLVDNPVTFMRSVVFHGLLAGMCGVIFLYWVRVPFFPTIVMLGALGVAAFVFRPRAPVQKEHTD